MPTFLKPGTKGQRKKPVAQPGHAGSRRETPDPDKTATHTLERCPDCTGSVTKCNSKRTRIIEDIQPDSKPSVTGHEILRYWYAHCRKKVEPVVDSALPDSQIGHRAINLKEIDRQFQELLQYFAIPMRDRWGRRPAGLLAHSNSKV